MEVVQTNKFKKAYRRFVKGQFAVINEEIRAVINNPALGKQKTGDLSWLRVHKFRRLGQLILLGYSVNYERDILELLDIGSHENFYRDLKR